MPATGRRWRTASRCSSARSTSSSSAGSSKFGSNWTVTGNLNYTTAKELNLYQRYFESITDTLGALPSEGPAITFALDDQGLAHPTRVQHGARQRPDLPRSRLQQCLIACAASLRR